MPLTIYHGREMSTISGNGEAGWTIKREERESSSGMKVYFRYTNPGGKTLKSAKDVERQLKSEGIYERFTTQNADQAHVTS